jgi:tape measure domain-containing protein
MASNVGNIKVKLNLDSAAYEYGLKACVNSTKTLQTALAGLGIGFGAAQIVKKIQDIGTQAIKASSDFEQAGVQFGVMLGDAKKAKQLVNEIQDMANVTPFETQDLLDASKTLLNFGINVKEILPDLRMLGDIAGGDKQRMQSLTLAFSQMTSAGRLMGQDLLQMINAGFNPLQVIAEKTGKSMAVLKDEMSEGKISVQMVRQAFIDATSEGGRFYGMMNKQSETLEGKLSTMRDSYTLLTRAISDLAVPALKEQVTEITKTINATTELINKLKSWAGANQVVVGGLKDAAVAIAALAVGIPLTNAAVVTIMTSMRNFGTITAKTTAYQIAFATFLKGDSALALMQFRAALTGTIVQVKALTVSLLACPLTWVTLVLGAGAAAWWGYRQATQETTRAIEELNNAQNEQVNKTTESIRTLKELQGVKNLDYNQTKRLDEAITYLTEKYPKYIGRLKEELRLKGEISRATAEQIANEMTLAKVKELTERKQKIDKKVDRAVKGYKQQQIISAARFGTPISTEDTGRRGASKALQRDQDAVNKELENVKKERQGIINELTALEKDSGKIDISKGSSFDSKAAKKAEAAAKKAAAEAKKRQKEALDLKIAQLEQEKYIAERTDEEIFQIELKQAEARLAATKEGTSEHAQALAQKLKLEQDHTKKVQELQQSLLVQQIESDKQAIDMRISNLELQRSAYQISKRQQLEGEIALIHERIALEKKSLDEQLKLMGNNEIEKVKLRRDSIKTQEQLTQELTRKNVELKTYELEKFKSFTDGMTSSFSSSFSSMLKGEQTFADACFSLLDSLVDNFIDSVVKMTSEWVTQKMLQVAYNSVFASSTTATNATVVASNGLVAASNTATAGSAGALSAANAVLTTSNATVAASAGAAAATTATSAGVMAGASATMAGGVTALVSPVTSLAGAFFSLATASAICAVTLPVIALSTTIIALSSALAALSLGMMNATMLLTATTSMMFAPISIMLTAEFAVIGAAATVAAKAVASLAVALAAASAAAIPLVGWAIAPGAALATGAAIMAADSLVQFREKGGPVEAGKPYVVGEKRPELFIPDRSGTILPDTSALNGGGGTTNQYSISVSMPISTTDAKSFETRLDEFTNRIHSNLSKGIKKRKLTPLTN